MEESYFSELVRRNLIPFGLGLAGIIFLVIGIFIAFSQNKASDQLQFEAGKSSDSATSSDLTSEAKIVVDIEGAIIHPGIYSLATGSRMHDLIVASGGLSSDADRDSFAKSINQASKLADGQKVYIPRVGESIQTSDSTSSVSTSYSDGLIGINSASLKDLDTLPGIGPVTAQRIVDNRPYLDLGELTSKKVVSSSVYEKIKDKISIN